MPEFCKACKAPIVWAMTPAGKPMPVDRGFDRERGNVLLQAPAQLREQVIAVTLSGDALALARRLRAGLRLSHHSTCPDVKLFDV